MDRHAYSVIQYPSGNLHGNAHSSGSVVAFPWSWKELDPDIMNPFDAPCEENGSWRSLSLDMHEHLPGILHEGLLSKSC